MSSIQILNAYEGNLKNISLEIPKNQLVVFTGVSGSGKSTLLVDVLFNECQRQFLEALSYQGIHKPHVERVKGASPAIVISQTDRNRNPRSTVGTVTNVYTDLRMVYEKLGVGPCPHCGAMISAGDCKEETEKIGEDFLVYQFCCQCGERMKKITRTDFSFNTKEGACPTCGGLGEVHAIRQAGVSEESLSLEEGAIRPWEQRYGEYQTSILYAAFRHYGIPIQPHTSVQKYSQIQKSMLYHGIDTEAVRSAFPHIAAPKTAASGRFEGVFPILWRKLAEKEGDTRQLGEYFDSVPCPDCQGERLAEASRRVTVQGVRLPELSLYSLERVYQWITDTEASLPVAHRELVQAYLLDIQAKLKRFMNVGLGYLSLDRQTVTLSGGELQRLRLAAVLDSELSGVIYILDEPTLGLHPKDTAGLVALLRKLRDLGNTVLVIEHDTDVMEAADCIVDIGPGSGKHGGEIVGTGALKEIMELPLSATGDFLRHPPGGKERFRKGTGQPLSIRNARRFNLQGVSVDIPTGCLTTVTGPSGSGKSTLVFEVLAKGGAPGQSNAVTGLEPFAKVVEIQQGALTKMKRSNVATYSEAYGEIRSIFAKTEEAQQAGLGPKHFSFNTPGGRCENCQGLGRVDSNMLFFANIEVTCPVCNGNQFQPRVLAIRYQGRSIKDVLKMSVEEAAAFFPKHRKLARILRLLGDVGLGYLELGQTLTTLSGGEGQRLKLARELLDSRPEKANLYLLDEPTAGLHPKDIQHFLVLVNSLVEAGNTVVVVEHNRQVILGSDWIVDLGPGGGDKGGQVVFAGTPLELRGARSVTAKYL